jgi:Tol biopolymer transport system component
MAVKGTQLWLYHRDGGSGVQVTGRGEGQQPAHIGPAFAPESRFLWVNLRGNLGGGFATADVDPWETAFGPDHGRSSAREIGPYQIGQLDRETGRVHVRTHEHTGAFRPVPSPDGRWLMYATRYDSREALKLIDLTTGEDHWLLMDVQRDDSQGGGTRDRDVYPASAFTPDSRAVITSYNGRIWRVEIPSGAATEIPFTAHVSQELGPLVKFDYPIDDARLTVSQIRGARPSPDGGRIVFAGLDRLWIASLPLGRGGPAPEEPRTDHPTIRDARRLTGADVVEHAPVWSPDGRYVTYVTWDDEIGGDIYRMRSDGTGQPERLTPTSAFFDKIAYSRDGSRILAVRGSKMHRMPHSRTSVRTAALPSWSTSGCRPRVASRRGSPGWVRAPRSRAATRPTSAPIRIACTSGRDPKACCRYGTTVRISRWSSRSPRRRLAAAVAAAGPPHRTRWCCRPTAGRRSCAPTATCS